MQHGSGSVALQRLYKSVLLLASEIGRVEDRLALVYFKYLAPIDSTELSLDARLTFDRIRAELARLYPEESAPHDVDHGTASKLAMELLVFYDQLSRNSGNASGEQSNIDNEEK